MTVCGKRIHKNNNTIANNDLYGLGKRNDAMVLGSDYYGQTATPDPTDATRLQTSLLVDSTPIGIVTTAASGNSALVDYLNAQYDGGTGAGQYVFLRLNTAAPKAGISRASVTMSEGADDLRPQLNYRAVAAARPARPAAAAQPGHRKARPWVLAGAPAQGCVLADELVR